MLRFRYENVHDSRIKACKECKRFSGCPMYTHKLSLETASECMYGEFEYKHSETKHHNVDWMILQILRSVMLSKINADTLIRDHMMDWIQPEQLKDHDLENGPSVEECQAMKIALTVFSNFVRENRNKYAKMKKDTTGAKISFVNSIKDTYIEINNDEVKMYTYNSKLMLKVKDAIKTEKYSFRVIDIEEV